MSTPALLDPYDYAFQDDPYPVYARLRAEQPLHHNPEQDFWALTRHTEVSAAFRDEGTFSNEMGVSIDNGAWGPHAHRIMSFLALDGKRQQRLRSLVSRAFTPRRVRELAPRVQQLADHYLDAALVHGEEHDWIADVAGRLPMDVISEMMGVPVEDRDEVRRHADLLVHREDGLRDIPAAAADSFLHLVGYYADMLEQRRTRPTDDLTSALIAARLDGGDRLADEEIIAFLTLMVVAGNETTTKLLGNALFHLAADRRQLDEVLSGPSGSPDLVAPWIEETLRHDNSTQMLARHLLRPVEVEGVTAPAGAKLLLVLGSANRDETVFTDPARFDLHRAPAELARSVSFGGGRHFCLGANLARLEARIVLEELVRRVASFEVDVDRARRVHSVSVRGFASLPVTVHLRPGRPGADR
ncbi:cytochrome P450 [Nocardioides nanhaiensis]|uniref:Cytochrome P450 n=1 Tax=Nocardioides nanhaiensis TaxID=1476871 RepID=A0ABP8VVU4_9ACTN